jgi:hypothetical protein
MKGNVPCGTSACGRTVVRRHRVGIYNYNDSSAVKASSLSRGMMSTKYRWAKRDTLRLHETRKRKQPSFANRKTEIVKQKTNTCIDAANAEYYVNGVYVKPQASCLPGSTENQTCKTSRVRQQQLLRKVTASALHREPASSIAAKSQSDHIANLKRKCESNNAVNLLAQSLGSNVYTKLIRSHPTLNNNADLYNNEYTV